VTAAVAAGSTSQFASNSGAGVLGPAYADLVNLEHAVDPAYRFNPATYCMFNDATLKAIKKLVDGNNRPLWQPGLTASFRDGAAVDLIAAKPLILDHPYIINQDMAVPAASADSMLFGDMSTFKVREVAGGTTVMRLVERYADYLQVGFIAFQRFDSQLIDAGTHPVAVGVNAAS
jgi:HK97 family phage major capsid protein